MSRTPAVLYVEDNAADVHLFEEALRQCRLSISLHSAGDWAAALEFLGKQGTAWNAPTPDLILLDLNLPVVSGPEILRLLQKDPVWRTIPVVVFSSSHRPAEIDECYRLGACLYVVKPTAWDRYVDVAMAIARLASSNRGVLSKDTTPGGVPMLRP
jgi:CheY-like chemotaxis protein